jgi:hypothetical protein
MTSRDQRIRDVAYFLWLEDGCPEGEAERHWLAAEEMVGSEPEEEALVEAERPGKPKKRRSAVGAMGSE